MRVSLLVRFLKKITKVVDVLTHYENCKIHMLRVTVSLVKGPFNAKLKNHMCS